MPTQLDDVLAFAAGSRVPGGFGYLTADGSLDAGQPLQTWISARMTHVFALDALRGGPTELARHGVATLLDGSLRDREDGGWLAAVTAAGPVDDGKAGYVHAFVLLAGATATAAGIDGGPDLLEAALAVWEQRFWDDEQGMAVESWDRRWRVCEAYRGVNANMHGVEATLAAADALEPTDAALVGQLRRRALRTTERVVHGWARERDWRLPEHFTEGWQPLPDFNRDRPADPFRPYGVTPGHQFEWARLCLHLASALENPAAGDAAPGWLVPAAGQLFRAAADRGWAADGRPGFPYTLDWDDHPVVPARMHWVLCEAIAAAAVLGAVTGRPVAEQSGWEAHGEALFLDCAVGSWHHELTPDGAVGTGTWTGKPDSYHLVQMLLLRELPVRGSVAAGLLARG